MKVSYEERLATDFGPRRRCDCGNNVVLSVRTGGSAGQVLSSEILFSVCKVGATHLLAKRRRCAYLTKIHSVNPP